MTVQLIPTPPNQQTDQPNSANALSVISLTNHRLLRRRDVGVQMWQGVVAGED